MYFFFRFSSFPITLLLPFDIFYFQSVLVLKKIVCVETNRGGIVMIFEKEFLRSNLQGLKDLPFIKILVLDGVTINFNNFERGTFILK